MNKSKEGGCGGGREGGGGDRDKGKRTGIMVVTCPRAPRGEEE